MPTLPVSLDFAVFRESVSDVSYRWDNAKRGRDGTIQVAKLVWSGEGRYADRRGECVVGPNQIMIFSRSEPSRYWFPAGYREPWVFSWINLTGVGVLWKELRQRHGSVLTLEKNSTAAALLRECARRFEANDFSDDWESSAMSYEFVMSLAREAEESLRTPGSRLERARAMLLQSRGGPLGVKEVAAQMGLSREHFTRCFLKHFGESPGNLLRTARLQHAKSLLRQSSLGLEEIASLSGFGSAAALSHAFRGEVGVAPGEWRGNTQSRNRISRTMRGPKRA